MTPGVSGRSFLASSLAGVAFSLPRLPLSALHNDQTESGWCRIAAYTGETRVNEAIRAREVLLIGEDGSKLGVMGVAQALDLARQADLDLVEVAPQGRPPVCKLLDYNKWKYEEAQRDREARRKAGHSSIKEMKYRPKISDGDFDTKTRLIKKFLEQGHKVKITIMFRGREVAHPEHGMKILERIQEVLTEQTAVRVENAPRLDGKNMTMVLAPDKKAPVKKPKETQDAATSAGDSSDSLEPAVEAETIEPTPVAQEASA